MNWNEIEGRWKQLAGQARAKWGKLTENDLRVVAGKRAQLIGRLQERYGILKGDAEEQVDSWLVRYKVPRPTPRQPQNNPAQQAQGNPNVAPQVEPRPDGPQDDTKPSYRPGTQKVVTASPDKQLPTDSEHPDRP